MYRFLKKIGVYVLIIVVVCNIFGLSKVNAKIYVGDNYVEFVSNDYYVPSDDLKSEDYEKVFDQLYVLKEIDLKDFDVTKIPRYSISSLKEEEYMRNIENFFGSNSATVISNEKTSNISHKITKYLGNDKGSYTIEMTHLYRFNSDSARFFSYSLNEDLTDNGMVNVLLYQDGILFNDILTLSDEDLAFGTKNDAMKLVQHFVQEVYKYPNIVVKKIKALKSSQFQAYVDEINLNNYSENSEEWIIEPRDLYLIEFDLAIEKLPVENKKTVSFYNKHLYFRDSGKAIVSERGLEYISMVNLIQPDIELEPFNTFITFEELSEKLLNIMKLDVENPNEKDVNFYISNLETVYIPYNHNKYEMSLSPVWKATILYSANFSNTQIEDKQITLVREFLIDPLTGRILNSNGF